MPSYVGVSSVATPAGSASNITVDKGSGLNNLRVGDLLIAQVCSSNDVNVTTPSGWSQVARLYGPHASLGPSLAVLWRFADAGDVAASSWTFDYAASASSRRAFVLALRSVDLTTPLSVVEGATGAATGTAASWPNAVAVVDDSLGIRLGTSGHNGSFGNGLANSMSGWVQRVQALTNGYVRGLTRDVLLATGQQTGVTSTSGSVDTGGYATRTILIAPGPTVVQVGQANESDEANEVVVNQGWEWWDPAFSVWSDEEVTVFMGPQTDLEFTDAWDDGEYEWTVEVIDVNDNASGYATPFALTVISVPVTVNVGQATETDSSQAVTPIKTIVVPVAQAQESDTTQTVTPIKTIIVAVGQATESDLAQAVEVLKPIFVAVGQALESDTAQPVEAIKTIVVTTGQATESDAAQTVTPRLVADSGQAVEANSALAVTARRVVAVGQTTETDEAQSVTPDRVIRVAVDQATETSTTSAVTATHTVAVTGSTETDSPQPITAAKPVSVGFFIETDTAQPVTHHKRVVAGQAPESDTAQSVTATRVIRVHVGQATETALAQPVTSHRLIPVGQATTTDSAFGASPAATIRISLEQTIAGAVQPRRIVSVGLATSADTANSVTVRVPFVAKETDTANPVTPVHRVPVTQTVEADLAQPTTLQIRYPVTQATEEAEALRLNIPRVVSVGIATEVNLSLRGSSFVPTPPERTYAITPHPRVYHVPTDLRTSHVPSAPRVVTVSLEGRLQDSGR